MNIWELRGNEGYNYAFLKDSDGKVCHEDGRYFLEIQNEPHIRDIMIKPQNKGFSDIMSYLGTSGSCIVSKKLKLLLEKYYGNLAIQFFPCRCEQFPDVKMWILNVCEYHDVLDIEKSVYRKGKNRQGESVIVTINKYAFTKQAFDLDIFKIYINNNKRTVHLFVSDRFKTIMEENGVTGLALKKVYSI